MRLIYLCVVIALLFVSRICAASTSEADTIGAQIEALQPKQLSSVMIVQQGQTMFEHYYNDATADTLHNIRSASKSFTGLMFGVAIRDKYFADENQKVMPVFSEYTNVLYPGEKKSAMTFFDLLSMTNPLECDDNNTFSAGHEERMYLTYDWVAFFLNLPRRGNPPWEKPTPEQPYGRDFAYCTAGISITGAAIERRSGKRLSDYTQQALFIPMGIQNVRWQYNEAGMTQGGGGVEMLSRDMVKIGQLVLQKGLWRGRQLIPQAWIEKSLQPYSVSMPEMNAKYGLTWWHFTYVVDGQDIVAHAAAGNGGNYIFVLPELDAVVVITATAYSTSYMHRQAHQILSEVALPALLR